MDKEQQIMELWRRNFHDSDEFIRFYFARKYKDENALVYTENGKPLSALLLLPYPMSWQGITLTTSYISGACTLPEARNQGLMSQLLREAFLKMNERHIALSTLIPAEDWLFRYYGKLGYAPVFEYSLASYVPDPTLFTGAIEVAAFPAYEEKTALAFFPYFNQKMHKRLCCVQHPEEDYRAIVEETYLSGGQLLIARSRTEGNPLGWALSLPENGQLWVKELLYSTPEAREALLQTVASPENLPVSYKTLPQPSTARRYGMARITDVLSLLQHLATIRPTLSLSLKVNDPYVPANNGVYTLHKGQCTPTVRPAEVETDIPALTQALLGYRTDQLPRELSPLFYDQTPYMNLMLD